MDEQLLPSLEWRFIKTNKLVYKKPHFVFSKYNIDPGQPSRDLTRSQVCVGTEYYNIFFR